MLRLLLPPNLAAAAPRNAIAVRVELDLAAAPPPAFAPGLAVLQRLGVPPQPVSLIQLNRAQLREVVNAFVGEAVFFRADRPLSPLAWNGLDLPGVSEHLADPVAPAAPPPAPASRPKPRPPAEPDDGHAPLTVDGSEHYLAITLPSRESAHYDGMLEFLRHHRFVLDPLTRKWWLRDRHRVLNLLATHGTELREDFGAEFTENFD
ncbi:MAG: ATP-dependent helicase, partial [Opitutus sp.]